jgi:nitrate reductase delta subunit
MKGFKALSLLLSYPTPELQAAVPGIRALLQEEGLFGAAVGGELEGLLQHLESVDIWDLEEQYVLLFDRSRSLSLDLFEHVHGEGRDRGGAMVDLLETYRAAGFDLAGSELPDHLPVLLEFLSTQSEDVAREVLADAGAILAALAERLLRRGTAYASVLVLLSGLARVGEAAAPAEVVSTPADDPEDLIALDASYAEAEVVFGPQTGAEAGCPGTHGGAVYVDASRLVRRAAAPLKGG